MAADVEEADEDEEDVLAGSEGVRAGAAWCGGEGDFVDVVGRAEDVEGCWVGLVEEEQVLGFGPVQPV